MRRRLLVVVSIVVAVCAAIYFGIPWYVNTGRATPYAQRTLSDRLGAAVTLRDLHMDGWRRISAESVDVEMSADTHVHVDRLDVPGLRPGRERHGTAQQLVVRASQSASAPGGAESRRDITFSIPALGSGALRALAWVGSFHTPIEVTLRTGDGSLAVDAAGALTVTHHEGAATDVVLALEDADPARAAHVDVNGSLDLVRGRILNLQGDVRLPWAELLSRAGSAEPLTTGGELTVHAESDESRLSFSWSRPGIRIGDVLLGEATGAAHAPLATALSEMDWDVAETTSQLAVAGLFESKETQLSGRVRVDAFNGEAVWSDTRIQPVGSDTTLTSHGRLAFKEGLAADGELQVPAMPLGQWAEYFPLAARLMNGSVGLDGALSLDAGGQWNGDNRVIDAQWHWTEGSLVLDDFRQAAGLAVSATTQGVADAGGPWRVQCDGTAADAEVLWSAWYHNFAGRKLPFHLDGTVSADNTTLEDTAAQIDLGGLGKWSVTGDLPFANPFHDAQLSATDVRIADLVQTFLLPLVVESRPWTADAAGDGEFGLNAEISSGDDTWSAAGRVTVSEGALRDPTDNVIFEGIQVDLPFLVGSHDLSDAPTKPELGRLRFDDIRVGGVRLQGAELPLQLWNNAFVVASPYTSEMFDGELTLDAMWGVNVLSNADREWQAEVSLRDIDLDTLSHAFEGFVPLTGELNGRFSRIHFANGDLDATGAIEATVYSGAFLLTQFGIKDLRSPYRTYTADIAWDGINLEEATDALGFGRITGRFRGGIKGLEVQAGQPAAFDAEFASVRTPGVRQTLSVQAVNNISVLGTGRGLGGILSRGLTQFFDEFKYETIGFHCTLKNDRFRIQGIQAGPDGEYFVKGTFLPPTINVINRDPNTVVGFREMVRRFTAVDLSRVGGTPAQAKGAQH